MNKRQLIEALEPYADDAPVVVAKDTIMQHILENHGGYQASHGGIKIWAVSDDMAVVRLEL